MKFAIAAFLLAASSLANASLTCSEYVKLVLIYQQGKELGIPFREALKDAHKDVEKYVSKAVRPKLREMVRQGMEAAYTIEDPAILSTVARARCQVEGW